MRFRFRFCCGANPSRCIMAPMAPMDGDGPRRQIHWGRWLVRVVAVPLAVIALAVSAVLGLWPLTPSVDSAPTLVNDILNTHGARHLPALPVPNRVGQA